MAEFNWTVDDIERAQRDFSYNFMRLDCIRTESYDVAIDCMTECIEKKAAETQPEKRGRWISSGRDNDYNSYCRCSNCNHEIVMYRDSEKKPPNYCENCGFDMRGDMYG